MSATLLNCFGEKEINPICKSLWIVYYFILHDVKVNLINIFLQLTFFSSNTAHKRYAITA